ncbi:F-box/LRR-repeat protein 10-like isoform X2 [Pyrus x bretschneideri]|uniref:F-box/LRR-repeat protein 10-like isoform X2 n=1 Tax=Pyrus x bretschneideri TaxID=225117 RepID=UPI00202EC8E7|nr:F-box/LRR-repeat protein 10-like isoform X2 [Pyrus x bretschneideri]
MAGETSESSSSIGSLPSALLATIMTKLDVTSFCSVASTSTAFKACASHILSFIPSFHILEIAPSMELLRPLLVPNPWLKSVKVNCGRLDDSTIQVLLQPSLEELCMLNCTDFSGKLLSEIGGRCKDLRYEESI